MSMQSHTSAVTLLLGAILGLIVSLIGFVAAGHDGRSYASAAEPTPAMVSAGTPVPRPRYLATGQTAAQTGALASTLSYYFIPGNTFTPNGGSMPYVRQVIGCVNQTGLPGWMSAPVHLVQGSKVVSITLYTYNTAITTTGMNAEFIVDNGMGFGGITVWATSSPSLSGYQQITSTNNNPWFVDNQNYNHLVTTHKSGTHDSI